MAYKVLIIEDDLMVAEINRQYVEHDRNFTVIGSFKSGTDALEDPLLHEADLIILDYYTPGLNGQEFLDRLHARGLFPQVIAVTSASDAEIVRSILARGVLDYLVKPFTAERFAQALQKFSLLRKTLRTGGASLNQASIDQLLHAGAAPAGGEGQELSKGLNAATLEIIRSYFHAHPGDTYTSEQMAGEVHLSRITVRRYVNHMVETGELVSSIDYATGGRPSILYRYAGNGAKQG